MCQRKANRDLEHCLSGTYGIKARPEPNLQDRKSLNFQEEIERKSKVSKLSDVESVETVEADTDSYLDGLLSHGGKLAANQSGREGLDPGTCDTAPGFPGIHAVDSGLNSFSRRLLNRIHLKR